MRNPTDDDIVGRLVGIIGDGFNRSLGALERAGAVDTRQMRGHYKGVGSKHYDLVTEQNELTARYGVPVVRELFRHREQEPEAECPELLRNAFLDLLARTLLYVRLEPTNAKLCHALSDHVHNVPALLARFRTEQLRYYWEVERPCFLRALETIGRKPPGAFDEPWQVVEGEYRRLCGPPPEDPK